MILAGVSIATLTGNNGILTQTTEAKTETRANSVKEARDLWETNKTMDQRTGTSTAQTLEQLVDDLTAQGLLTEDEKDKIIGNEEKGIEAQYGITIGKTVITFSRPIAKVEPDNISDWEYTIDDDGFATITCYKGNDTKVVIPNSINGVDVKRVDSKKTNVDTESSSIWGKNICNDKIFMGSYYKSAQGTITEVTVSEGIEEIGTDAFSESIVLNKINFPSTLRKLGKTIIYNTPKLSEMIIPYGIQTIGEFAFMGNYENEGLESIVLPESVKTICEGAFLRRRNLKTIKIPKSVTSIEKRVFEDDWDLTNIEVDSENENYKSIDGILYNKDGTELLKGVNKATIEIPEGTKIIKENAFTNFNSVNNVILSDTVENIERSAFSSCPLKKIIFGSNVTNIGDYAFAGYDNSSIEEITIPKSVKTMGKSVFNGDTITINVYFKENERPEGWDENWNHADTWYGDRITVNYAK